MSADPRHAQPRPVAVDDPGPGPAPAAPPTLQYALPIDSARLPPTGLDVLKGAICIPVALSAGAASLFYAVVTATVLAEGDGGRTVAAAGITVLSGLGCFAAVRSARYYLRPKTSDQLRHVSRRYWNRRMF